MTRRFSFSALCSLVVILAAGIAWNTGQAASQNQEKKPYPEYSPLPQEQALASHIQAIFRSGQTFITWDERTDLINEHYRVYRSSQPINSLADLSQAQLLRQVPKGTSRFFAGRYYDIYNPPATWKPRNLDRYVINDFGSMISATTGLLVWTLAPVDFGGGQSGSGYYSVTVVPSGGTETFMAGYNLGPIPEQVQDPQSVEVLYDPYQRVHYYIQYMDLRNWNPTFHAPRVANSYYGLNANDMAVKEGIAYAYDYAVETPDPNNCGGSVPATVPVAIRLHGYGYNEYYPFPFRYTPNWCAYRIFAVDEGETWWYGFADKFDYRIGDTWSGNHIVNYTEQRLLRMVYDLERRTPGNPVDPNRIYAVGASMGGSGGLALALRYPNVFAAIDTSVAMTNYATSTYWKTDLESKWGAVALNLPTINDGPNHWADRIKKYNETGVYDWQNHQNTLKTHPSDPMTPFGFTAGMLDTLIEWPTQGQLAFGAMNVSQQVWGGVVANLDHAGAGALSGLPPNMLPKSGSTVPFAGLRVVKNETVPGLSNDSTNIPIPPNASKNYNYAVRWSASWDAWDGAPIDRSDMWQISLCAINPATIGSCGSGTAHTVDVTPRRMQFFAVGPNLNYNWQNIRISDGVVVQSGTIKSGADSKITLTGMQITPGGNRIRITPGVIENPKFLYLMMVTKNYAPPPAPPAVAPRPFPDITTTISVFNDQLASNLSAGQLNFAASHYVGTQKMTRADADALRKINPYFIILHYRLGEGLGYRATNGCSATGSFLQIIEGSWVQEWPGDGNVQDPWFYYLSGSSDTRVLNCSWGWYLAELDDASWRNYWQGEVVRQIKANNDDGVFMDSLSVPNYFGATDFNPNLPVIDPPFEQAWSTRIQDWLAWLQTQPLGGYWIIPNAGSWITTRDVTDYSAADGVMVEGFATGGNGNNYALADWQLQMNRILGLVGKGKIFIGQTYPASAQDRMFALGSYLLVKGGYSYLNLETSMTPEWWPEYILALGAPTQSAGATIDSLLDASSGLYRRNFDNGFVLVNPATSGQPVNLDLGGTYYLAQPAGGGPVPTDGSQPGTVNYSAVTSVSLPPATAVVLMNKNP